MYRARCISNRGFILTSLNNNRYISLFGETSASTFRIYFALIVYNDRRSLFGGFMFGLIALLSVAQAEEISTSDVFVPGTEEQANNGNKKK